MSKYLLSTLILCVALSNFSFAQSNAEKTTDEKSPPQPIKSWLISGSNAGYEVTLNEKIFHSGKKSASMQGGPLTNTNYPCNLLQTIKADAYRGKRMRLSAFVQSSRGSGHSYRAVLGFRIVGENMQVLGEGKVRLDRFINLSTDWKKFESVLDIPGNAQLIEFGVTMQGLGQTWVDSLSFEEVSRQVPVTSDKPQDVQAKESLQHLEKLRSGTPYVYELWLERFKEQHKTASTAPANLDFESF
jgi:hypothetical protein